MVIHLIHRIIRRLSSKTTMDLPLVVIIGSTGCGKSKLAIEVAQKYDTEIISADSMQVYKGLDIITNKVTTEERLKVKHHLIDFLHPKSRFTVTDFRNRVLPLIDKMLAENKMPIIVGGTNYYIESILWNILIDNHNKDSNQLLYDQDKKLNEVDKNIDHEDIFKAPILANSFSEIESKKLHTILQEIDPQAALSLHPNEKRKIIRCLQVYQQHGRPYSDIIAEQKSLDGGSSLGGPLRYKNALILWLQCEQNVLNERLDKRVDEMIEQGLINELLEFHENYNKYRIEHNLKADYTHGIFQSIGFKEFHKYLILSQEEREKPESIELFNEGVKQLKFVTRRYAKHQIKWIRNRFLSAKDRSVPNVYALDATHLDEWQTQVTQMAFTIIDSYVKHNPLPVDIKPLAKSDKLIENEAQHFYCDSCKKVICGTHYWTIHLASRWHKKKLYYENKKKKRKYEELMAILNKHERILSRRNSI